MTDVMTMADDEPRTAEHGEKMITLRIKFWTNNIADRPGEIVPKTCHNRGMIGIVANDAHGIRSLEDGPVAFNGLHEIPAAIERVLALSGITVVFSR